MGNTKMHYRTPRVMIMWSVLQNIKIDPSYRTQTSQAKTISNWGGVMVDAVSQLATPSMRFLSTVQVHVYSVNQHHTHISTIPTPAPYPHQHHTHTNTIPTPNSSLASYSVPTALLSQRQYRLPLSTTENRRPQI